jgi:ABC-type Fe3+/spermidine/putrescine transport system ATPase subunit
MADLRLTDIRKSFGATEVLGGITLDIPSGAFISLLGASGCGKTTLLRIVAGLESTTTGRVEIAGRDVTRLPPEKRDIAMMFQSYALLPHLDVAGNVRFPLRMRGIGTAKEQRARVAEALETVQLGHLASRRPRQLSGGQQQRVALARAIVSRPRVLLLDEPLSNLDARLREDMQVELIELHRRLGLTTQFVTHDQEEALSLSDRIVLLNGGRIEQQGSPAEIYAAPATPFAATFLGAANLLRVEVGQGPGGPLARLPDGQTLPGPFGGGPGGPATLALRQEDALLLDPGTPLPEGRAGLAATAGTRVFLGARNRYVVDLGGQRVRVLVPAERVVPRGAPVVLAVDPARLRLLPAVEG